MEHLDLKDEQPKKEAPGLREQLANMEKMFSAQLGISMGEIQKVFDAQFRDWQQNFAGILIERDALKKRIQELEKICLDNKIDLTPPVEEPPVTQN